MASYINGNGIRPGYVIKYNGNLYRVMSAEHRTPGKGRASMQVKLRKLKDGTQTDVKFRADENIERAEMEQHDMEYLYSDPSGYCFMHCETYEQIYLGENLLKEAKKFMLSNTRVIVEYCDGEPLSVNLPETVDLKITETDPPLKGATASGSAKPATLETGVVVHVPQFVEMGEIVRVSTSSGEYLERVKK